MVHFQNLLPPALRPQPRFVFRGDVPELHFGRGVEKRGRAYILYIPETCPFSAITCFPPFISTFHRSPGAP